MRNSGGTVIPICCAHCGAVDERHYIAKLCWKCTYEHLKLAQLAMAKICKEVREGRLIPAKSYRCADCGEQARDYDHRDYRKPLTVEPVCRSCNIRRGHALPFGEFKVYERANGNSRPAGRTGKRSANGRNPG